MPNRFYLCKMQVQKFLEAVSDISRYRCRVAVKYLRSLAANKNWKKPVWLCKSKHNDYTYSNLTKLLDLWVVSSVTIHQLLSDYLPSLRVLKNGRLYHMLAHDTTKMLKNYSPCLPNKRYLLANNPIGGKKPLCIGYLLLCLHIIGENGAAPVLSMDIETLDKGQNEQIVSQLSAALTNKDLNLLQQLCVLVADSAYSKAKFIAPMYGYDNLVTITRVRSGTKVWSQYKGEANKKGTPRIFGQTYYLCHTTRTKQYKNQPEGKLQTSISELTPSCTHQSEVVLGNGRSAVLRLTRWNDMLFRTKQGNNMKDKPLDIICVVLEDAETGKRVFEREMYLAVSGKEKSAVDIEEAQQCYARRYDVEGCYRFKKQTLMLEGLQSPCLEHQKTWLKMVQLSYWLLYLAAYEVKQIDCPEWQRYLAQNKSIAADSTTPLRIAQAHKGIDGLFSTLPELPPKSQSHKKAGGRQRGDKMPERPTYCPAKKGKQEAKKGEETANKATEASK